MTQLVPDERALQVPHLNAGRRIGPTGVLLAPRGAAHEPPPNSKAVPIADAHAEFSLSIAWRDNPVPLVRAFVAMASPAPVSSPS